MLECGMSKRDMLALRKQSTVLSKQMVVDEQLIQCLQAHEILTADMAEGILTEKTSAKRNWSLLFLLPKRGPQAFSIFCSALRDTEQYHLGLLRPHFLIPHKRSSQPRDRGHTDLDHRKGGEVDEEVLQKVFKELDFVVSVHRNLTAQNKPKMFFIQACRGEEMDCGVVQTDGPERTGSPSCEQRDAGREGEADLASRRAGPLGRPRIKLPQRSDMICGFASLKGTAAMRNTKRGSWFIQELNTALRLRSRDTHLADILVQVNALIKEKEGHAPGTPHHRCKEMSEFTSSLCHDLFLFPKYQHQFDC
ncbi:hypothetical protein CRUP_027833 [Coryphaenoides rupestris]|nr:hypothetical protein CRUP_027833 [Coryphaenoides rupestris]